MRHNAVMLYAMGRRWPGLVIAASLFLVVTGATTLSMAEAFLFYDAAGSSRTGANGNNTLNKQIVDWLACEAVSITKARESSSSLLRSGAVRMFAPAGMVNAAVYFTVSSFLCAVNNYSSYIKNKILLKLRL